MMSAVYLERNEPVPQAAMGSLHQPWWTERPPSQKAVASSIPRLKCSPSRTLEPPVSAALPHKPQSIVHTCASMYLANGCSQCTPQPNHSVVPLLASCK